MTQELKPQTVSKKFDLGERTFEFSKKLLGFLKNLSRDFISLPIISQVTRSGTSIGANYREADGAESRKDFIHKIGVCKKETKETLYWLGLIKECLGVDSSELDWLVGKCKELVRIFGKISSG